MRRHAPLARLVDLTMRLWTPACAAALAAALTACASSPAVRVGWDEHADFSKLHTWAWKSDGSIEDPAWEQRCRAVVADELRRRGLEESSAPASADLLVIVHARLSSRKQATLEHGGPYGGGWGYDETVEHQVPAGAIVLDLVDARRDAVVWRGRAGDVFRADRSLDEREATLRSVVERMFASYPPAPGALPDASLAAR
jgi:hypothetical protein